MCLAQNAFSYTFSLLIPPKLLLYPKFDTRVRLHTVLASEPLPKVLRSAQHLPDE